MASVAEWIREDFGDVVDDDARENLRLMQERVLRMHRLIDGILAYSRATWRPVAPLELDAHMIAADVIASLDRPPAVEVRIEGQLPWIHCDETQLRQILQNLIENAVRHLGAPSGEVVVAAERIDGAWLFSVRDSGPGIPRKHHERIFGLFQTLRSKDDADSNGVGLAIVKRLVERAGGSVQVESAEGVGSTFRFSIPDPEETPEARSER
ncbi:MAG: ATP-binding protein [Candidatus Eisenbacteria bacterium]